MQITEVNIGIRPSAYKKLISAAETEPQLSMRISVNGGAYFNGKIKVRGAASKAIGFASPGKRLPLQLTPDQADLFAGTLDNACVKLVNSYTPFRLFGEYLALAVYDYLDVPAPAHSFVFLRFNGVDFGLYLAEEDVNAEFLKKFDPDGGGTLFKADYQNIDISHTISNWFGALRIEEDHGTQRFYALTEALDRGEGYEEYLDVDEVLRYFACLAVWGANSTILTEQNNFFLYDNGEKFVLIPWDNSEAFAAYETANGIDRYRMDPWEDMDYPPPLFTLLMENEAYKETYHSYIRQLNDEFLAPTQMDPYFNALAAAAKPYLEKDCTLFFNTPFETPVQPAEEYGTLGALLWTLHCIHDNLTDQLDGKTDTFYGNPVYRTLPDDANDTNGIIGFLTDNSPSLDLQVTEKIQASYSAWCRDAGRIPFDADDPVEIAVSTAVFLAVFLLLIVLTRKKNGEKPDGEKETT